MQFPRSGASRHVLATSVDVTAWWRASERVVLDILDVVIEEAWHGAKGILDEGGYSE